MSKYGKLNIGIVGCGNMGEAILIKGLENKNFNFFICEKNYHIINRIKKRLVSSRQRVRFLDIVRLIENSDVVIIAVKPQDIDLVLKEIKRAIEFYRKYPLVISIAAGIKTTYLEEILDHKLRVIRVMPNIGIKSGEGVIVFKRGRFSSENDLRLIYNIFKNMGRIIEIKKEELMDAVTAISGSGPAYIAFIFRAILKSAEQLGLDKKMSQELIFQTFLGTLRFLEMNNFDTEDLIKRVASKKGTTQKALEVFKRYKLNEIINSAIISAFKRAKELSN